eukprot:TRINITY_DN1482_c0_g1_i1.p1 TRINITY_DN1482_c0_g1~~TRINITY_DN1482_c0_g1_i1.p1  ORF type:complete len:315 (+),score=71.34 TRINITY_DN1482_c0_g1_i1:493-1437(+)
MQVRLVEDEPTYSTFAEVYEVNCTRFGREPDQPIQYFKQRHSEAIAEGNASQERLHEVRLAAYNDITKQQLPNGQPSPHYISESVLSQFMYKSLPSASHLWTFKKQFATQLALSACMSYMLHIGGRGPNKILFAKNTGRLFQSDFHPGYDQTGMVEPAEAVPFRLTRNLHTFFTQFGTDGLFTPGMCVAAQAMHDPKYGPMEYVLAMFFRDELISWSWRRHPSGSSAAASGGNILPADLQGKVSLNVEAALGRIDGIAPQHYIEEMERDEAEAKAGGLPLPPPVSVQRGVAELVERALKPKNLCMMDPTWHPWF